MYTAPELIMILGGVGVLLTGVGAIIVNIIVALKTGTKVDDAAKKTDGLIASVQEVHTLTNSNLSAVKAELATALSKIAGLHDLIQDLRAEREKAAIAHALATSVVPDAVSLHAVKSALREPGSVLPATDEIKATLKQIDVNMEETARNTEETAKNTARTDVTVNEIQKAQEP